MRLQRMKVEKNDVDLVKISGKLLPSLPCRDTVNAKVGI